MRRQRDTPADVSLSHCPHCGAPAGEVTQEAPLSRRPGVARRRRHRFRRIRRFLAVALALGLLAGVMLAGLLIVTPPVTNAPALVRALDGAHHAVYPGPPVPQRFAASLVASEDHRFYAEAGIDPIAIARVGLGYLMGKPDQGGSTLYQQLAGLLYTPGRVGVLGKAERVLLGIKLDFSYSKAQILQMYADAAYFGHGYYGLRAASCGYFGLAPAALSWPQAALLAGLMQGPSADDPLTHPTLARARESYVLGRLAATGGLTQSQAGRAYRQPLHLTGHRNAKCAASPSPTPPSPT